MTTLSEATATRRSLIESILLTLQELDSALSDADSSDMQNVAEQVADNLIDSAWVTEEPK